MTDITRPRPRPHSGLAAASDIADPAVRRHLEALQREVEALRRDLAGGPAPETLPRKFEALTRRVQLARGWLRFYARTYALGPDGDLTVSPEYVAARVPAGSGTAVFVTGGGGTPGAVTGGLAYLGWPVTGG
jgi:hypothetical protein